MYSPSTDLELVARLNSLPEGFKQVILSPNTATAIEKVAQELSLSSKETDTLVQITLETLSGGRDLERFDDFIAAGLHASDERAGEILDALTEKFLTPFMKNLEESRLVPTFADLEDEILSKKGEAAVSSEMPESSTPVTGSTETQKKAIRSPASVSYTNLKSSASRVGKEGIIGDPYREQEL